METNWIISTTPSGAEPKERDLIGGQWREENKEYIRIKILIFKEINVLCFDYFSSLKLGFQLCLFAKRSGEKYYEHLTISSSPAQTSSLL